MNRLLFFQFFKVKNAARAHFSAYSQLPILLIFLKLISILSWDQMMLLAPSITPLLLHTVGSHRHQQHKQPLPSSGSFKTALRGFFWNTCRVMNLPSWLFLEMFLRAIESASEGLGVDSWELCMVTHMMDPIPQSIPRATNFRTEVQRNTPKGNPDKHSSLLSCCSFPLWNPLDQLHTAWLSLSPI